MIAQDVARLLLKIKAVSFRFDPPFTFTSGVIAPIYIDNRLIMSYPKQRDQITQYFVTMIKKQIGIRHIETISATATSAIPQGAWIADRLNLPLIYVRKSVKLHGKGKKIEGRLTKDKKVLIVEDHVSTALSLVNNACSVRELGGRVTYCVAVTTYETPQSNAALVQNRIKLFSLTTGRIIVREAAKIGLLTKAEKVSVEHWFDDPINWAKRA